MGLLRYLLAVCVVAAHTAPIFNIPFIPADVAVQAFFIISGFYMAFILEEKYGYGWSQYWLFISNRWLRLLPLYWFLLYGAVLLSALVLFLFNKGILVQFFEYSHQLSPMTLAFLVISNVMILGQDSILFMGKDMTPTLHSFVFIPQAWSISIELMFYLIAPIIFAKGWRLPFIIMLASFGIRWLLIMQGLTYDPWTYRFFPSELGFFMMGYFSYLLYKKLAWIKRNLSLWQMYGGIVSSLMIFGWLFTYTSSWQWLFFLLIMAALPVLFSSSNNMDRLLGELSYPVYLSHLLIAQSLCYSAYCSTSPMFGLVVIVLSTVFSLVCVKTLLAPLERYRQQRISV